MVLQMLWFCPLLLQKMPKPNRFTKAKINTKNLFTICKSFEFIAWRIIRSSVANNIATYTQVLFNLFNHLLMIRQM